MRNLAKTDETSPRVSVDWTGNDLFTLRASYSVASRRGSTYTISGTEIDGFRRPDEADRDRNKGTVLVVVNPTSFMDVTVSTSKAKDTYSGEGHEFGLLDNDKIDGIDAVKTYVIDCVLDAGGKTCPPTIVGVGVGGTADLCVHLSKVAATRALGSKCSDPEGAKLEEELSAVVNKLGVGPQVLGGDSTSFAVHVETAATHITMNPVAVNMQCHSARRARATFTPAGVAYGY